MKWPPSEEFVIGLLSQQEGPTLDFKREWYALDTKPEKAKFVKDVLSMANVTSLDTPCFIVIGKEDVKQGGALVGSDPMPTEETLTEILTTYTFPTPDVRFHQTEVEGKIICVIGILHTPEFPYYAHRDISPTMSANQVYTRRGSVNGVLRPYEFAELLRSNGKMGYQMISDKPIEAGFVQLMDWNATQVPTLRVMNLTAENLHDVSVVFDVIGKFKPNLFCRVKSLTNATLKSGESREVELNRNSISFSVGMDEGETFDPTMNTRHGWLDVIAHIRWRGQDGLFHTDEVACVLTG